MSRAAHTQQRPTHHPHPHTHSHTPTQVPSDGLGGEGGGESLIASGFSRASNARFGADYGSLEPRD